MNSENDLIFSFYLQWKVSLSKEMPQLTVPASSDGEWGDSPGMSLVEDPHLWG